MARRLGFQLDRQRGGHAVYRRPSDGRRVVVPTHPGDLKRGTLRGLLHDLGITVDELLRLR